AVGVLLPTVAAQIALTAEPVPRLDHSPDRPSASLVVRHGDDEPHPLVRPDHLAGPLYDLVFVRYESKHARGQTEGTEPSIVVRHLGGFGHRPGLSTVLGPAEIDPVGET